MTQPTPIPKISTKKITEIVLLSLIKNEDCDAADIIKKIGLLGFTVPIGTVYPLLSELRHNGIISHGFSEDFYPAKRCYDLTEKGQVRLTYLKEEWGKVNSAIIRSGIRR